MIFLRTFLFYDLGPVLPLIIICFPDITINKTNFPTSGPAIVSKIKYVLIEQSEVLPIFINQQITKAASAS